MHAHERYPQIQTIDEAAVQHWLVSGKSARQITTELGINEQSLKQWKLKFKQLPAGQVAPTLATPWPNRAAAISLDGA